MQAVYRMPPSDEHHILMGLHGQGWHNHLSPGLKLHAIGGRRFVLRRPGDLTGAHLDMPTSFSGICVFSGLHSLEAPMSSMKVHASKSK